MVGDGAEWGGDVGSDDDKRGVLASAEPLTLCGDGIAKVCSESGEGWPGWLYWSCF